MAGHPEKTPIDGKDSRLRSFRLRQPPRAATQRQPRQRKHRPFRGVPPPFFLCGGLLGNRSRRRYRLLCAGVCWPPPPCRWRCRCRCSVLCCGRWCCSAGVAAAPEPTGALGRLRQRTGEGPGPATRATGLRRLPQKTKTQKESVETRCRRCRVLCPRFRVVALPASRPGVAAGSRTGERRCPRPLHRYPG